jgi:3-oxoacyl-[acyl-carrier protein] reductase
MQKTILVTGSSRGIGKAIATLAHKRGYRVIVHGRTDSDELNQTCRELTGSVKTFFDISNQRAVKSEIAKVIEQAGAIDVLINNAGARFNPMKTLEDLEPKLATKEWEVNALGTLYCIQAVLPGMLWQGGGSIVNIASIKGVFDLATISSLTFSMAKSAVISLTKSLAKTYSDKGVRFNVVNPGYTETDQVKDWGSETLERIKGGTILGRMAKPEEIAPLVMFLASDEASYITGSEFLADGGYSLKGK